MQAEITLLYEDQDVLVINKPAGIPVHADGRNETQSTVADWVLTQFPKMKGVGEPMELSNGMMIDRPGIVHRIDRDTSGVLVLARHQESFAFLKKQFQSREIKKKYLGFVYGSMNTKEGIVNLPIGKSARDFRKWSAERGAKGVLRDAETFFRVIESSHEASFIELFPTTGRTHQLRVHLKAIHHPIVCDKLYAPKRACILGFNRHALHASMITFKSSSGGMHSVEALLPQDFIDAKRVLLG